MTRYSEELLPLLQREWERRREQALTMREQGMTYVAIGKELGICTARARQLCLRQAKLRALKVQP